jgi:hypothetical protein
VAVRDMQLDSEVAVDSYFGFSICHISKLSKLPKDAHAFQLASYTGHPSQCDVN